MKEQQKKIQMDGSTGRDSETTKTGITFSIDGITYHVSEDDMVQIDASGNKGIMIYAFFNTDTYKSNPLPATRKCSKCGAVMNLHLSGCNFSGTKPAYEGESTCCVSLTVLQDYILKDGDNLEFSISYCDA